MVLKRVIVTYELSDEKVNELLMHDRLREYRLIFEIYEKEEIECARCGRFFEEMDKVDICSECR